MTWPAGLQMLTFGKNFDQNLDNVTWPAGLQSLTFAKFSAEKLNVVWPEGLQSLSFLNMEDFDVDFKVVREGWPRALRKLVLGDLTLVC